MSKLKYAICPGCRKAINQHDINRISTIAGRGIQFIDKKTKQKLHILNAPTVQWHLICRQKFEEKHLVKNKKRVYRMSHE